MEPIKSYKAKAFINGLTAITPSPLSMRVNDTKTPKMEVEAVYLTYDGKQRPLVLTDKEIIFETITPGGRLVSVSNESSEYLKIIAPAQGRFSFVFPPECKDAAGVSKKAYFRFVEDDLILSAGDFMYSVLSDVYSVQAGDAKTPQNYISDLERLKYKVEWIEKHLEVEIK